MSDSDRINIETNTVHDLIKEQFPQWADLEIKPVEKGGWDNRTFHLGDKMLVRLPSAERYASKVAIEQSWLPIINENISVQIPEPIVMGVPSKAYPWNWSIYNWIEGVTSDHLDYNHHPEFANDCARFLKELQSIPTKNAPNSGEHNFFRGSSPIVYNDEVEDALENLGEILNNLKIREIWERAVSSEWHKEDVWVHGDFAETNILVDKNKLKAVIDFGGASIGDPSCDLTLAWTYFNEQNREIFRYCVNMDQKTWWRAQGWCLWKSLKILDKIDDKNSKEALSRISIINSVTYDKI